MCIRDRAIAAAEDQRQPRPVLHLGAQEGHDGLIEQPGVNPGPQLLQFIHGQQDEITGRQVLLQVVEGAVEGGVGGVIAGAAAGHGPAEVVLGHLAIDVTLSLIHI